MNPLVSAKEWGLIKQALRRVFSRSEHRRKVLEKCTVDHVDPNRPRVGKWGACAVCGQVVPRYLLQVDHITPIVGVHETLEQLGLDEVLNRIWCDLGNLQPICKDPCHSLKSEQENRERRKYKKWLKTQSS